MWRRLLAVVVVLYAAWGLCVSIATAAPGELPGMLVPFGLSLTCVLSAWRREKAPALMAATAVLGLLTDAYVPYTGLTALFIVVYLAPFRMPLWQALALAVVTAGGFVGISLAQGLPGSVVWGIGGGMGWAVLFAAVVRQLAVTKRQSAQLAATRVLAERQRLAREIHDILAHSLSAQVVHLEGTRMLLERDGDRAVALARVEQAGAMARAGLEETKRAVAALRGESAPLVDELGLLAEQFRETTGNRCVVEVSGDPSTLSPEARLAVVRTAQEALTNVHKHAPMASVTVALRCPPGRCELDVSDTGGRPGALSKAGNGYGLVGMRERAELLGGELTAGPSETGFRVSLTVPA
ncbi:sensor histidine kinase [Actinophytocola sp.]|uniref:sensor histidine kinase n=1 Tax=Actinophytocola sp. TaxID=1872138 RepID=UPI00389B33EE